MRRFMAILFFLLCVPSLWGRDVYVIGMHARGADTSSCSWLRWRGDVLFYNTTDVLQRVRVVDVSNGTLSAPRDELDVPPRSVISLYATYGTFWDPVTMTSGVPLWLWRLDVPIGVKLESQMELREEFCTQAPINVGPVRGQLTLPTFETFVPPGEEQIFLGTDLGELDRRLNVSVYNAAATEAAVARIDVYRSCDSTLLATRLVTIPPDSVVQVVRVHTGKPEPACPTQGLGTYAKVTVDQPSLAFASALANEDTTRITHNFVVD